MLNNKENQNTSTWKGYVDSRPVYFVIGWCLAYFVDKSGVIKKVTNKFLKKD